MFWNKYFAYGEKKVIYDLPKFSPSSHLQQVLITSLEDQPIQALGYSLR